MVNLKTTFVATVGQAEVKIQEGVLDAVMPNLLPLLYTFLMYKLLKKGMSPIMLIGATVVIGILGKAIGIL